MNNDEHHHHHQDHPPQVVLQHSVHPPPQRSSRIVGESLSHQLQGSGPGFYATPENHKHYKYSTIHQARTDWTGPNMHFPPARTTTHYKTLHQTKPGQIVPNKPHKMHFPPDQAKCISHQIKQNAFPTRSDKMHFPPDQAKCISHQIKQNAFPTCQDSSTCSVMRPQQCSWLWVMSQALKIQLLSHFHVIVFVQAKLFLPFYRHFRLVGHNCVIIRKMLQK